MITSASAAVTISAPQIGAALKGIPPACLYVITVADDVLDGLGLMIFQRLVVDTLTQCSLPRAGTSNQDRSFLFSSIDTLTFS